MATNAKNLRIGDCDVYLDDVLLGYTKGGVEFTHERGFEDLTVDQYGTSPLDMALKGQDLKVKAIIAEVVTSKIKEAVPEGAYVAGVGNDGGKLGLGTDSGYLLEQDEQELRLHPRAISTADEDIYLWKAVSVESLNLNYKIDEQRVLEITWRALVDTTQPNGYRLGRIGNADVS